ncbi:MAG: hypothetical protein AAF411_17980 [Myxococcota bacterium]
MRALYVFLAFSLSCTDAARPVGLDAAPDARAGDAGDAADAESDADAGDVACIAEGELEAGSTQVDVLWVVDTSSSMRDEADALRLNLLRFAEAITSRSSDHRWILVADANSLSVPDEFADPGRFFPVDVLVSSNNAPEILTGTLPELEGILRPGAVTHVVIVSDDDGFPPTLPGDERITLEEFRSTLDETFPQGFQFHAVTSPPVECETAAGTGEDYWALSEATGGFRVSVCTLDWSSLTDALVERVTTTSLPCEIPLVAPEGLSIDFDRIDFAFEYEDGEGERQRGTFPLTDDADGCSLPLSGEPTVGWYIDRDASEVRLCPLACSEISSVGFLDATVAFGCPPGLI